MMIQLAYRSECLVDDGSSDFFVELAKILEKGLVNNAAMKITGVLAYADGHFIQILEGPVDQVDRLYTRIAADPRHVDLQILQRKQIAQRSFGAWSMAYIGRGDGSGKIVDLLAAGAPSDSVYAGAVASLVDCIG